MSASPATRRSRVSAGRRARSRFSRHQAAILAVAHEPGALSGREHVIIVPALVLRQVDFRSGLGSRTGARCGRVPGARDRTGQAGPFSPQKCPFWRRACHAMSDPQHCVPSFAARTPGHGRAEAAPALLPQLRIALLYGLRHGRLVRCHRPVRFTDWIQWRKLYDGIRACRPGRQAGGQGACRRHARGRMGHADPLARPDIARPAAVGTALRGQIAPRLQSMRLRPHRRGGLGGDPVRAGRWMRGPYGTCSTNGSIAMCRRAARRAVSRRRRRAADRLQGLCVRRPRRLHQGRPQPRTGPLAGIYDLDWRPIWSPEGWSHPPPPASLAEMVAAAETLGKASISFAPTFTSWPASRASAR